MEKKIWLELEKVETVEEAKRGEFVPDYGDAAKVGSFNGRGSL